MQSKISFKFLLASDIHLAFDNIKKLNNITSPIVNSFDYILLPGDLCNFDPKNSDNNELVSSCEGEMTSVITAFENFSNNKKVIYIPGNHDAKTTLLNNDKPKLTQFSENVHNRCFRIHEDIVVLGLGGSLPSIKDNKPHWEGYPYQLEQEVAKELNETYDNALKSGELKESDKIILFTHMGPFSSSTTIDQLEISGSQIYSGSKSINDFILAHQSQILLNIHGHTHNSIGMARVGKTFIVNPGSLRTGHFAVVTLEKYNNEIWKKKSIEFDNLL